jgi:hypothetical protein
MDGQLAIPSQFSPIALSMLKLDGVKSVPAPLQLPILEMIMIRLRAFSFLTALCANAIFLEFSYAQANIKTHLSTGSSPVAYVYVVSNPRGSNVNEIVAFAAASDGKLTPVAGSPFQARVTSLAVNGKYLFGSTQNGLYVAQFQIESNGSLRWIRSTDVIRYNPNNCGTSGSLVLDHTGTSLYDFEAFGDCSNTTLEAFAIQKPSGQLHNLGVAGAGRYLYAPLSFTGNNMYAYTMTCVPGFSSEVNAFRRAADGSLSSINITVPMPTPKQGTSWCMSYAAADPANHLATTLQPLVSNTPPYTADFAGPAQLATYTVDNFGKLTTTSTYKNMPSTSVGTVLDINMAPSGTLLAVAGTLGLQVFRFNGSNPIEHYTGLLTKERVDQC